MNASENSIRNYGTFLMIYLTISL